MRKLLISIAALVFGASACTVHQTDVPSVGGPSVNAITLNVTATPDTVPQNGTAKSTIVVKAFNAGGQPYANLGVRLDMQVSGTTKDLGTLSVRNLVTGADGTATATYTAPLNAAASGLGNTVAIVATPVASDASNAGILNSVGALFQAYIHLTSDGTVNPNAPETPTVNFSFSPSAPTAGQIVLFNGVASCPSGGTSTSCNAATTTITGYDWDFGDGTAHGSGSTATHTFTIVRPYAVKLTVTNSQGNSASSTQTVTVATGVAPTALFTALPNPSTLNGVVTLDATPSTGAPINYKWQITSPSSAVTVVGGSSPTTTFTTTALGTWTISLTVTNAQGLQNTSTQTITAN